MFAIRRRKTGKYVSLTGRESDKPEAEDIFSRDWAAAFYARSLPATEVICVPEEDLPQILKRAPEVNQG